MDNIINKKFDEVTGILNIRRFSRGYIYLYEMVNVIMDCATYEVKFVNLRTVAEEVAIKTGKAADSIIRALRYIISKTDKGLLIEHFGAESITPSELLYGVAMKISCDLIRKEKLQ